MRVGPADTPVFVSLEIADTGVGIPAENLPHIFDRFYRVRSPQTNSIAGLGLGLSFVSWIVQAHDGRIEVASTDGRGNTLPDSASTRYGGSGELRGGERTAVAVSSGTLETSS